MKKLFALSVFAGLFLTLSQPVSAQEETVPGKMFYTELGGPGILMSAHWDARFQPNTRFGLGYRIGAGFSIGDFDGKLVQYSENDGSTYAYYEQVTKTIYSIPVGLNYVFGKPNVASAFEVGAGASFLPRKVSLYCYEGKKPGHFLGFFTFMYRLTPVNGGLALRIGFTPIIGTGGDLFPMGAVSLGYTF